MISRSICIGLLVLVCIVQCKAQFELRSNPLRIFIGNPNLSLDYHISKDISVELLAGLDSGFDSNIASFSNSFQKKNAYQLRLVGKYYYNSKRGADKWFSSIIASHKRAKGDSSIFSLTSGSTSNFEFVQNSVNIGFGLGYKWISYKGFVLELSTGYVSSLFVSRSRLDNNTVTTDHLTRNIFMNATLGYLIKRKTKK